MARTFLILAALNGLAAVALGAFGAHGLQARLADAADAVKRLDWWRTAAHYHLVHAVVLGLVAVLAERAASQALAVSGWAFLVGMLIFGGSLYAMALGGPRWLGAVTPLGGVGLLIGWGALLAAALKR